MVQATAELARYIVRERLERIPPAAIEAAKDAILDCLGVSLAGSREPCAQIAAQVARQLEGAPQALVLGHAFRTALPQAAFINGVSAHALDYDDVNDSMDGHPSGPVLPVVLALGEVRNASGRELLESYVVGFEVEAKIGRGLGHAHYELGWHSTSTLGVMGAAAAAAKLLKLDETQTSMALGLAASQACGLRQNFGTMTKPFHVGNAARGGLMAALLAQKGFTADPNILEGPYGFCRVLGGEGRYNLEEIVAHLGNPYDLVSPGVRLKKYPSCAFTHEALDAILYLIERWQFSAEEVAGVECGVVYQAPMVLIHQRPQTGLEGKFSMPYCLAAALLDRQVGLEQFADEEVRRPVSQSLMERVRMYVHPDLTTPDTVHNRFADVKVRLRDGREYAHRVYKPKGHPQNPLTQAELRAKFAACANRVLSAAATERLLDLLAHLEYLPAASQLIAALA